MNETINFFGLLGVVTLTLVLDLLLAILISDWINKRKNIVKQSSGFGIREGSNLMGV